MIISKKKRREYLGFNDFWFMAIGVILLGLAVDYIINNSFARYPLKSALINVGISICFAVCNWLIIREILIYLRKWYPSFRDNAKRIVLFFLSIVITVTLIDLGGNMLLSSIFGGTYNHVERSKILLPVILISTMTMAIYEAVYYYIRLKKSIREEEQAKQAIVQAQLDALRNQAQPHFFFNTLNTLRDIIDQNPKEDAKEFVDKLSDVYRFILESGNDNVISLREELKFAKSYIHIQTERFGKNLKVNWNIPNIALGSMVVPMSLQLLLENAIKHNVISKAKPLVINVAVEDDHLVVDNKMQSKSTQLPSTKVGLKNIEKRYTLISSKTIDVKNDGNRFVVSLPLLKVSDQKKHYAHTDH